MHEYEDNVNWIGKTITDVKTAKTPEGCITDIFVQFSDGWASQLGGTVHECLTVVTMPNDQGERQPPEQQNRADNPKPNKNQNLAAVRSTDLLDDKSRVIISKFSKIDAKFRVASDSLVRSIKACVFHLQKAEALPKVALKLKPAFQQ